MEFKHAIILTVNPKGGMLWKLVTGAGEILGFGDDRTVEGALNTLVHLENARLIVDPLDGIQRRAN